jgi:hypothetical protein
VRVEIGSIPKGIEGGVLVVARIVAEFFRPVRLK